MANLKEIRNRISSVSSTMQITGAMKMVSAAKLKRAQDAITAMRPYSEKLASLLQNLISSLSEDFENVYAVQREVKKVLIVPISSNRGLAGAFNSNIMKESVRLCNDTYKSETVSFFTIGKKVSEFLKKNNDVVYENTGIFNDLNFENVSEVASLLMKKFTSGEFDKIVLVYNTFKNAAVQNVLVEPFLPISSSFKTDSASSFTKDYVFEPSKEEIVEELIPKSLKVQLYKAIRDSFASEHGARMTAMHKATDNAKDLRDQLKLTYNKVRQASITNEILEIVGGAEALNS